MALGTTDNTEDKLIYTNTKKYTHISQNIHKVCDHMTTKDSLA